MHHLVGDVDNGGGCACEGAGHVGEISVQWTLFNDFGFLIIHTKPFVCLFLNSFMHIYSKVTIITETKDCKHDHGQITQQVRKGPGTDWTRLADSQLIVSSIILSFSESVHSHWSPSSLLRHWNSVIYC